MSFKTSLLVAVILQALSVLGLVVLRLGDIQDWPVMKSYETDSLRSWLYVITNLSQADAFLFFLIGLYRKAARSV